jgi:hypothetical protein
MSAPVAPNLLREKILSKEGSREEDDVIVMTIPVMVLGILSDNQYKFLGSRMQSLRQYIDDVVRDHQQRIKDRTKAGFFNIPKPKPVK